eukprot:scaffold299661_cov27-Tisochrysis_lutea.AAC.1
MKPRPLPRSLLLPCGNCPCALPGDPGPGIVSGLAACSADPWSLVVGGLGLGLVHKFSPSPSSYSCATGRN